MKASELIKKSIEVEFLYDQIKKDNDNNRHKHIVPFGLYVSSEVSLELMRNGFKLTYTNDDCLIIEW